MCFYSRTNCRAPRSCVFTRRGSAMSIISVLLLAAIFFLILYLIWLLPAPWRVRQIIQIVAVILGLVYLFQHQTLLHF